MLAMGYVCLHRYVMLHVGGRFVLIWQCALPACGIHTTCMDCAWPAAPAGLDAILGGLIVQLINLGLGGGLMVLLQITWPPDVLNDNL